MRIQSMFKDDINRKINGVVQSFFDPEPLLRDQSSSAASILPCFFW